MAKFVDAQYVHDHLNDAKVVNVLSEPEYEREHIPGSLNAPVERPGFDEKVREMLPDKAGAIIVHCSDNDCKEGAKAARRLEQIGYTNVLEFKAGIQGWRDAGYRLESTLARPPRPGRTPEREERQEPPTAREAGAAMPARRAEREEPPQPMASPARPSRGQWREQTEEKPPQAPRT